MYNREYSVYSSSISNALSGMGHEITRTVPNPERQGKMIYYFKFDDTINEDFKEIRDKRKKNRLSKLEANMIVSLISQYKSKSYGEININILDGIVDKLTSDYYSY